jgi:hypothetical protein
MPPAQYATFSAFIHPYGPVPSTRPINALRQRGFVLAVIKTKSSSTSNAAEYRFLRGGSRAPLAFGRSEGKITCQAETIEEVRVTRRLAPMIGLLVGLGPAAAYAQTNIDQGKTPAQIFANDCAACHKGARGLARGRDSGTLADFLREHYTTSREQAAALAAYVLGAGGNQGGGTAAQERGQKPTVERARAPAEEPKASERQARRPATEEGTPATAKPPRPAAEEAKPQEETGPIEEPSPTGPARRSATKRNETRSAKGTRGRHRQPEIPPPEQEPAASVSHEPAAAAAEPSATETPSREATPAPSAAVPQNAASGEATPVPRDNIPD